MPFNTLGTLFSVTTFGESHGEALGAVIDGCPAGFQLNTEKIQYELNRRRPGQSTITTARNEPDEFQIVSGVFEGKTTGAPITILIMNKDARSKDYDGLRNFYRPSHADFVYEQKYGHHDYRGGGRSSARTTAPLVAAGAIAAQLLEWRGIHSFGFVHAVGKIALPDNHEYLDLSAIDSNPIRCPDIKVASEMEQRIEEVKKAGDSVGGVVKCVIKGVPVGLGEPLFEKLNANLAKAMFSINAVKGVDFGDGFASALGLGSEQNDLFEKEGEKWKTTSNHSGGIQGGISNGMDIVFKVAFKPVSTIGIPQHTADKSGEKQILEASGRHDACVVPRAVPIVDALASIVILNHMLITDSFRGFRG
jgi:chorismate synthase